MMNMYENLLQINKVLKSDSDLWKLLYYRSSSLSDDPLNKPDVLSLPPEERKKIMDLRLKHSPTTDDMALDDNKNGICRLIFFPKKRKPQNQNYFVANQDIVIEIYVHKSFNDIDLRLSRITDRINKLFSNERITGLGKVEFVDGDSFILEGKNYIGYYMIYRFGSMSANV